MYLEVGGGGQAQASLWACCLWGVQCGSDCLSYHPWGIPVCIYLLVFGVYNVAVTALAVTYLLLILSCRSMNKTDLDISYITSRLAGMTRFCIIA